MAHLGINVNIYKISFKCASNKMYEGLVITVFTSAAVHWGWQVCEVESLLWMPRGYTVRLI